MSSRIIHNTVFISYRRECASFIARSVFQDLRAHGYDVFMDVENIDSGQFDQIILRQIAARAHFLPILTSHGTLERCSNPNDWLRREIEEAIRLSRNIVPLLDHSFDFNTVHSLLVGDLTNLPAYNAVTVPHDYFDAAMEKLRTRFLTKPFEGEISPTPKEDHAKVQAKIDAAIRRTAQQRSWNSLVESIKKKFRSAAHFIDRGKEREREGDLKGAVDNYSEAIRRNPDNIVAYRLRGDIRKQMGDLNGVLADYSDVLRIDPDATYGYSFRADVRKELGDIMGAIADYTALIKLKPNNAYTYYRRGCAYGVLGEYKSAIADFTQAIGLDPHYHQAYVDRAKVYFCAEQFKLALGDFQYLDQIKPQYNAALAGLAITYHALGQEGEALRIWRTKLIPLDSIYQHAEQVGQVLNWPPRLVEEARKLIAKL